ncbi:MAG: DUF3566 domain-containing protein [Pseudonocardiaceae bacterium]
MTKPENVEQTEVQAAVGDGDPKTVTMQVGAPEHSRGSGRDQTGRQPAAGRSYGSPPGVTTPVADRATSHPPTGDQPTRAAGPDFSAPTVRVGGYTPPERVPPPAQAPNTRVHPGRVPRRTSLQLQRLEPWSVLKLSLVLSVAGFLVWMVAVGVLYGILGGMGVWDEINGTYSDLTSVNNPQANTELISGGRVFGVSLVIGLVNIVLMTALATVGSLVYNIGADLVGGVEVTLSEPD